MTPKLQVSVVLPTYNESAGIVPLVQEILAQADKFQVQVVVVDDDSPDDTAGVLNRAFDGRPDFKLIVRKKERGLAGAVLRGVKAADYDWVAVMDSDFNHHPRDLIRLLNSAESADLVIGSRYVPGGGMNTSRLRYLGSYAFNLFLRLLLNVPTTDNLSGFIVARKSAWLSFPENIFAGYGDYAIALLYLAHQRGLALKEVPVVYENRIGGESKTRFVHHLLQYTKTAIDLRRGKTGCAP